MRPAVNTLKMTEKKDGKFSVLAGITDRVNLTGFAMLYMFCVH